MLSRATKDRWVMVKSSDKMWSTGEGNDKPLQYFCLENPMNSMERQKDTKLKDDIHIRKEDRVQEKGKAFYSWGFPKLNAHQNHQETCF